MEYFNILLHHLFERMCSGLHHLFERMCSGARPRSCFDNEPNSLQYYPLWKWCKCCSLKFVFKFFWIFYFILLLLFDRFGSIKTWVRCITINVKTQQACTGLVSSRPILSDSLETITGLVPLIHVSHPISCTFDSQYFFNGSSCRQHLRIQKNNLGTTLGYENLGAYQRSSSQYTNYHI